MVGAVLAWHQQAVHVLSPEGVDGQRGHQGRVDSAAQAQHGAAQPVLGKIVAQAADQSLVDQLHSLGLLVGGGLKLLHVYRAASLLEIGHLAQHAASGVHGHGTAGKQVGTLAANAVHVDQAGVERLHNLAHAVARTVGALVVKHLAAAANHHVRLLHMPLAQLLEVLVEAYGNALVVVVDDLHPLAAHKAALLVGGEVLLGHHTAYGAVLHENDGVAEPAVLHLERHADKKGAVLGELHEALQGGLGALLQVGVAGSGEQRRTAEGAGREDGEQGLARGLGLKLGGYPFKVVLRTQCEDVVLYDVYLHVVNLFFVPLTRARCNYCAPHSLFFPPPPRRIPTGAPTAVLQ